MSKRKTNEEYLLEIKSKNLNVEPVETYIKSSVKIIHRCNKCGYEWKITPNDVLHGYGCPKCAGNIKKSTEQYRQELKDENIQVECLEEYINTRTKILHKCLIHNYEWRCTPDYVLKSKGCPKCGRERTSKKQTFTQQEYIDKIKYTNINVLGVYQGVFTPILHKCNKCGYEWNTAPNNILKGRRCPRCAGNIKLTHEEFLKRISNVNSNILILTRYTNMHTKIKCKCKICDTIWEATPIHLLDGTGCPVCANEHRTNKRKKSQEQFVAELFKINPNIQVLGEYKNNKTKIKVKCINCNRIWYVKAGHLLEGHGCRCNRVSKGEDKISKCLDLYKIKYITEYRFNNCKYKSKLPFDFYLPDYNMCIEYDGEQHYIPVTFGGITKEQAVENLKQYQLRDDIKTIYCQDNNIKLLRIPYWEINNIEEILNKELHI